MNDLLKYIFEEFRINGLKGIASMVVKIAAFFICLSPVFIYFLLYQPTTVESHNIFVSSTIIIGCEFILFLIVFSSSKVFSSILLLKKYNTKSKLDIEAVEHYYYEKSFVITTIFQGVLSLILIVSYYYNNPSELFAKQLSELIFVIIMVIAFTTVAFILRIFTLIKYNRIIERENDRLKAECIIKENEKNKDYTD